MQTVIISGANGGLGTACVQLLLEKGYKVIAIDRNDQHLGFAKKYEQFSFHSIDLNNSDAVSSFVNDVNGSAEPVYAALMLVGGFAAGTIDKTSTKDLQQMFDMNFITAFNLTQALLPGMNSSGKGRLIFIGARPALEAQQGKDLLAYALSKSLLFKLAEFINASSKGTNTTASVIVPSTIDTAMNRKSMPDADFDKWVKPEQIAASIAFLLSDDAAALREPVLKLYNNS